MSVLPDLDLTDLTRAGPLDEGLRVQIEKAVEAGEIAPALCVELARICDQQGNPYRAMWFTTLTLRGRREFGKDHLTQVTNSLIRMVERTGNTDLPMEFKDSLSAFFLTLDHLSARANESFIQSVVQALATKPDEAETLCNESLMAGRLQKCPSFLTVVLIIFSFKGRIKEADMIGNRLKNMTTTNRAAYRALAKLAIIHGEYKEARRFLSSGIGQGGADYHVLSELAAVNYSLGFEAEARDQLSQALAYLPNGFAEARQAEIRHWTEKLSEAMEHKLTDGEGIREIGSSLNYSRPDLAATVWAEHQNACISEKTFMTVSAYTNTVMYRAVEALFPEQGIGKVVNYGVSCGVREHEMASRFPEITFAGYDIAERATELNRENYRAENLLFESDLDALLGQLQGIKGRTVLSHCRTMDIMFPEAVKNVYRACRRFGVDLILAAEYFSLSFATLNYPDFDSDPVDTAHWDGILMVHNYNKILPETGYRIVKSAFHPLPLYVSATGEGRHSAALIQVVVAERAAAS